MRFEYVFMQGDKQYTFSPSASIFGSPFTVVYRVWGAPIMWPVREDSGFRTPAEFRNLLVGIFKQCRIEFPTAAEIQINGRTCIVSIPDAAQLPFGILRELPKDAHVAA